MAQKLPFYLALVNHENHEVRRKGPKEKKTLVRLSVRGGWIVRRTLFAELGESVLPGEAGEALLTWSLTGGEGWERYMRLNGEENIITTTGILNG